MFNATLTKDSLIDLIRAKGSYPVKEAREILEAVIEEMKMILESGDEMKVSGFGVWRVKDKSARTGWNPTSRERLEISARRVVTFHPSALLRNAVNKQLSLKKTGLSTGFRS